MLSHLLSRSPYPSQNLSRVPHASRSRPDIQPPISKLGLGHQTREIHDNAAGFLQHVLDLKSQLISRIQRRKRPLDEERQLLDPVIDLLEVLCVAVFAVYLFPADEDCA